jgi:hypothetical protein
MVAFTLAQVRKAVYPQPIFCARLDTGEVASLTFFSEQGKPLDIERGRRLVYRFWGRAIVDWFVLSADKVVARGGAWDTPEPVATKKVRVTTAELRKELEQWQAIASRLVQAWPEDPITARNHPLIREVMERLAA